MIWPAKKIEYEPTDEQVGNGAYYDLREIKGWNAAIDACKFAYEKEQSKPVFCLKHKIVMERDGCRECNKDLVNKYGYGQENLK